MKSTLRIALVFALIFAVWIVQAEDQTQTSPYTTREQMEAALHTAKVTGAKWLGTGVTRPRKLTLSDGKNEFHAVFKDVDMHKPGVTVLAGGSTEMDFKDSWRYDVAAYEIDKMMGLDMVPVTVERSYDGKAGAYQWWVENAMTEKDRLAKGLQPPDKDRWNRDMYKVRLFDNLIYNIDRNLGNLLITEDWTVWMIDHSRCFKNVETLRAAADLERFSISMMDTMRKLDEKNVKEHCGKWLSVYEIRSMLKRRDLIVEMYNRQYATKGDSILFP